MRIWRAAVSCAIALLIGAGIAHGQIYLGAEGGWASLDRVKDTLGEKTETTLFFGPPTPARQTFAGGFNVGARGGYRWGPWRVEEEYSHRENSGGSPELATILGTAVTGSRTSDAIMTNLLYDFTLGWPVTPHLGVGIGAVELTDSIKAAGIGRISNSSDWELGYQAIAGARYDITPVLAVEIDYRYLATTDATFHSKPYTIVTEGVPEGIPVPGIRYGSGYSTQNLVASLIYSFAPPPTPPAPPAAFPARSPPPSAPPPAPPRK
jgi:opacity protein-like surface antigen